MTVLGASNAFLLAPATTLISHQGMNSYPPGLGGAYALFNLAYAAGLMLGQLLAGTGTSLTGFTSALCVVAAVAAVLEVLLVAGLPNVLQR